MRLDFLHLSPVSIYVCLDSETALSFVQLCTDASAEGSASYLAQHGKSMQRLYTHQIFKVYTPQSLRTTALLCPAGPLMAHQLQQLRNRQKTTHGTTNLTKYVSKEALLRPDVFLVITARCIWPIFDYWQQKQLCEMAKEFCYTELGVHGPLIQVYGDMLPPSDFLIIVPRTREVPDMIRAASKFICACHKLSALSVQLQLGQLAVLNTSGIVYTMLRCWQTAQNDCFYGPQYNTGQCLVADPQLSLQRVKPNSCPHIAAWRRINMSHRPAAVSVQLLAELSPKDATVFAL